MLTPSNQELLCREYEFRADSVSEFRADIEITFPNSVSVFKSEEVLTNSVTFRVELNNKAARALLFSIIYNKFSSRERTTLFLPSTLIRHIAVLQTVNSQVRT